MTARKLDKRRTLTAIAALLAALFATLFVASCSSGNPSGSTGNGGEGGGTTESVLPTPIDGSALGDDGFDYSNETDDSATASELRSRRDSLRDGIESYVAKFATANVGYAPDADGSKLEELVAKVNRYLEPATGEPTESDKQAAKALLYSDRGLNGLYGVYQNAYRFYLSYVDETNANGYLGANPDRFAAYNLTKVKEKAAEYLVEKFSLKGDPSKGDDCSTDCLASKAAEFYEAFRTNELAKIKTSNDDRAKKVADLKAEVDFYKTVFFSSGKYEDATVNADGKNALEIVYGENNESLATEDAESVKGRIDLAFLSTATSDSQAADLTKAELDEYVRKVTVEKGLKTFAVAAKEKIDLISVPTKDDLQFVENCLTKFDALSTVDILYVDGNKTIDLKTMKEFAENADKTGEDWTAIADVLNSYVGLANKAIDQVKNAKAATYDNRSAEIAVSCNVRIARSLASDLSKRYGDTTVSTGKKIVEDFESSYTIDGALVGANGERSYAPIGKSSSISSGELKNKEGILSGLIPRKDISGITITLVAVDADDNPIDFFDGFAKIRTREGATASVERNINLILNDEKKLAKQNLSDEDKETIKDRSLLYHFTITIMEPEEAVKTASEAESVNFVVIEESKIRALKEKNARFKVEITFSGDNAPDARTLVVAEYGHAQINNVEKNNGEEETKMTFYLTDVAAAMTFEILSEDAFKNIALFVALGAIGVIALILIVWAIAAAVTRKKYKVRYDANGGRFGSNKKVKYCKNLVYPNNPTRKGYQFMGWYTNKKGTKKFDVTDKLKRRCVKVYAKWMPLKKFEKVSDAKEKATKKIKENVETRVKVKNGAVARGTAGTGLHQAVIGVESDPRVQKLEVERLSYEAKKAEEERRAEEVRLQTIREIEAAKGREEAQANAEKEAEKAKLALQQALAEREALISLAKAEERSKVLEEMLGADAGRKADADEIEKVKRETEDRIRRELNLVTKVKANDELVARIKALEDANAKIDESRVNAIVESRLRDYELRKYGDEEVAAKIAEAEAKAEAEARKAKEADEARLKAEEAAREADAARIRAEEEASRAREGVAARLAAELSAKVTEEEIRRRAEEEAAKFNAGNAFDAIKAEMLSYSKADDLEFALDADVAVCSLKLDGDKVEVEANLDKNVCEKNGYNVVDGDKLAVKLVVDGDDAVEDAKDFVEDAMYANGYAKISDAVVVENSNAVRANGYSVANSSKVADNADEFYKLLRVYAKSFVMVDGAVEQDKPLMKMFASNGKIYVYLNYDKDGLNRCGDAMASEGYKTLVTVSDIAECKEAVALIGEMMSENGLVRVPTLVSVKDDANDKGFTYALKA